MPKLKLNLTSRIQKLSTWQKTRRIKKKMKMKGWQWKNERKWDEEGGQGKRREEGKKGVDLVFSVTDVKAFSLCSLLNTSCLTAVLTKYVTSVPNWIQIYINFELSTRSNGRYIFYMRMSIQKQKSLKMLFWHTTNINTRGLFLIHFVFKKIMKIKTMSSSTFQFRFHIGPKLNHK